MRIAPITDPTTEHGRAVIARALEPELAASQATIDMIRALKGPPVPRPDPAPAPKLSDHTKASLLQAAIVGESRVTRPWYGFGLLQKIVSWRQPPREMPNAEAFETPVRN